ncbi:MAG: invasion associated locus B family protein [Hyphomicrobium sp.]
MDVAKKVLAILIAAATPARAIAAEKVSLAGTYGDWSLMTDDSAPHLFCFVTSEPKSTDPSDAKREAPRAYISAWPKDGIRAEVSFRMGFRIKKTAPAIATVSPAGFKLFGSGDRAYVIDSTRELKLVEAMRKGSNMMVAATSDAGAAVTDTYSLNGIGQALQKLQEICF